MTLEESAIRHRAMAREYAAGDSMDVIAARHKCSKSTVRYAINTYGVKMRPSGKPRKAYPLKPAAPRVHPDCCGRKAIEIVDWKTGNVLSYLCWRCWRGYE